MGRGMNKLVGTGINDACGIQALIIMTKGHSEDIFAPFLWEMDKMMEYWKGMA